MDQPEFKKESQFKLRHYQIVDRDLAELAGLIGHKIEAAFTRSELEHIILPSRLPRDIAEKSASSGLTQRTSPPMPDFRKERARVLNALVFPLPILPSPTMPSKQSR